LLQLQDANLHKKFIKTLIFVDFLCFFPF
jgi:hypothetical protein